MTTLTQGIQTAEWLLSEGNSQISRDKLTVTIAGGVALPSGQVLGKITATGKYVAHNTGASDGSQNAAAILYTPLPGVNGDYPATAMTRFCEVIGARLNNGNGPANGAAVTALGALGIIVR